MKEKLKIALAIMDQPITTDKLDYIYVATKAAIKFGAPKNVIGDTYRRITTYHLNRSDYNNALLSISYAVRYKSSYDNYELYFHLLRRFLQENLKQLIQADFVTIAEILQEKLSTINQDIEGIDKKEFLYHQISIMSNSIKDSLPNAQDEIESKYSYYLKMLSTGYYDEFTEEERLEEFGRLISESIAKILKGESNTDNQENDNVKRID
jgi:hypothetical protein